MAYYKTMQPQQPPLRVPGEVINGRYTVAQIIGKGASGEVYVVSDREINDRLIALKYMKLDPEYKPALDHFKSEFNTMTHLNHPHIAKVYDFEWDDDLKYYFFTSELIDGFNFVSSVKKLDIEQTELLLIQSLRALEYLHGHGIFHYDIKPHNILVQDLHSPTPMVKVIDFGLASTTPPDRLVGTPGYIAPEIISRKKPDCRADLYSLGVLAYYALTGVNPFRAETKEETLKNQIEAIPPTPMEMSPSVPEYLSSIVMKLIEKNPNDRYASAADVIRDLNFRSPRFHAIETPETLLSYIPWEGPFVERKKQIEIFKGWLEKASIDRPIGTTLWISGDLGTGKSRFIEECKNIAQLLKFNTIIATDIGAKFLKRLEKAKSPSLIIIDDFDRLLEKGEEQHIAIFKALAPELNLIITSYENTNSSEIIEDFFRETRAEIRHDIVLTNFSIRELREYIRTLTGLAEAPNWLVAGLFKFTAGNPLFLTETMKLMISGGQLFDQGGRWKKSTMEDLGVDFSHLDIPKVVQEKIGSLLEKYSATEKNILALISTFIAPVPLTALTHIMSAETGRELKNLVDSKIISHNPNSNSYSFRNAIAKRAVYRNLPLDVRRSLHDKIAEYLQTSGFENDGTNYHIQRGTDANAARKALLEEINTQIGDADLTTTINEFLERFGDKLDGDILNILLLKAKRQISRRNLKEAHTIYEYISNQLPPEDKAPEWHFKTRIALGTLFKRERNLNDAVANLNKAKRLSKLLSDPAAYIVAENHLAGINLIMGNLDYAIEGYDKGRRMVKELDAKVALGITNNDLGHAYFNKGNYAKAADILKEDAKIFRKIGDDKKLCRALYSLGEAYRHLRKYDRAESIFSEIIEVAKKAHDVDRLFRAYNGIGNVLSDEGNFSDSIGYFERALDLAIHMGDYDAGVGIMINTAIINSNVGDTKKAFDTFQTTLSFLERKDFPVSMRDVYLCRTHLELGELYRLQKKFDDAGEHLEKALALAGKPQAKFYLFWVLLTEAKLAKDMKEDKKVSGIIKKARKLADSAKKKKLLEDVREYTTIH